MGAEGWHLRAGDRVMLEHTLPDGSTGRAWATILRVFPSTISVEPIGHPGLRWRIERNVIHAMISQQPRRTR